MESFVQNLLIKTCVKKTFKGFGALAKGKYIVESFSIKDSTHGMRVRADFDDFWVYLPVRFYESLGNEDTIKKLNEGIEWVMVYDGKDKNCMNR